MKKSKLKAILIGFAILYALLLFIGVFGYIFFDLGKILNQFGQIKVLLSFLSVYSIGFTIILVFFRANGYLFHYKDYEILAPLPIHPRTVLLSKTTVMMVVLYFSSFLFSLPIAFSYFYWTGFNLLGILTYIVSFFFMPLIPVLIMSFISLLITRITSQFRKSKIFNIILMFTVFIALFLLSFSLTNITESNPLTGQIEVFSGFSRLYPPIAWFINAIYAHSLIDLLLLVVVHGGAFILFIFLIQGLVQKTNQAGLKVNVKKNGKLIKYRQRSVFQALIQKEAAKFFSVPLYAVNAGFGPVIMVVLSIASLFFITQIEEVLSLMIGTGVETEILILVFVGFCVSMTYTPAISLSLEGKNLWIIKSLPIKAELLMFSKIAFNVILALPLAIVSILLFGISFKISVISQILLLLLISVYTILISTFDAIINLHIPKFDFINEVEVVKQSAGALIGVFGGFALMAINGVFYAFVSKHLIFSISILLLITLNVLLLIPLGYYVKKKSNILISKMNT